MKKLFLLTFSLPLLLGGCNDYDDGSLRGRIDDLEERVTLLEERCKEMNTNISSLQTLVDALGRKNTIESVDALIEEGKTVGYKISFTNGESIPIYNGTNANAPAIGVAPENGVYYWTLNGEWLTAPDGSKIEAEGKEGSSGVTPQLKIEEEYWWVSTDLGKSWEKMGKATGDHGDSFFTSVTQTDTEVVFTLADGTAITLPKAERLRIRLESNTATLLADTPVEIAYTLLNAKGETTVEVISSEIIRAKVEARTPTEGTLILRTATPEAIDEYTRVLVFASDDRRTAMAAITFEKDVLRVADAYEVDARAQQLVIPVVTNLDYTITVEAAAQQWISQLETRAIRTDNLVFQINENTGSRRSAIITLKTAEKTYPIVVAQAGGEAPAPVDPPVTGNVELDRLYGYAEGTTGGEGATAAHIHHFDDGNKFREWLYLREKNKDLTPAIVYLSGTFTKDQGRSSSSPWFDIKRTGNLTILGTDNFVMQHIGFFINDSENIIIRNVYIQMPKADNGADGISMQESHNIWVDHCTFESFNQTKDYEDGSCDVTHATYNVTVSWCHFIKTQKTCLVGHSNSASADTKITATFHHNYFDLSSSRHPRVRFGRVHVYNNFFNQVSTYGVGSAYGAMVLVEDNLFESVQLPTDICTFPAKPSGSNWVSNLQGSVAGFLYERDNVFRNRPEKAIDPYPFTNLSWKAYNGEQLATPYTYNDFKPAYNYIVDDPEQLSTIVPSAAGVGKLPGYTKAPIEVDNGGITTTDPDPGTDPDPDPQPGGSDLGNGWTLYAYGSASPLATVSETLTLKAQGKFESGTQTFGYVYREVTGDFEATVTVDSYETPGTSNQSLAGLMLTPDFTAAGTDFMHIMAAASAPAGTYMRSVRTAVANASRGALMAPATVIEGAKPVLKLVRSGNECSISYSLDQGATFGKARTETFTDLPQTVCLGLAVNSGNNSKPATAVFSQLTINGEVIPFVAE